MNDEISEISDEDTCDVSLREFNCRSAFMSTKPKSKTSLNPKKKGGAAIPDFQPVVHHGCLDQRLGSLLTMFCLRCPFPNHQTCFACDAPSPIIKQDVPYLSHGVADRWWLPESWKCCICGCLDSRRVTDDHLLHECSMDGALSALPSS